MADKIEGYLEVDQDQNGTEIIVNLPKDMTGHIKFSPNQARNLATILNKHADEVDQRNGQFKPVHIRLQTLIRNFHQAVVIEALNFSRSPAIATESQIRLHDCVVSALEYLFLEATTHTPLEGDVKYMLNEDQ